MKPTELIKQIRLGLGPSGLVAPLGSLADTVEAIGRYLDEQYEQGNCINGPAAEALAARTQNLNERIAALEAPTVIETSAPPLALRISPALTDEQNERYLEQQLARAGHGGARVTITRDKETP